MSASTYSPNLSHLGIACIDIDKMIDFYTTVFRMQVTD
jgi:catechol 2,3-dioxygenase